MTCELSELLELRYERTGLAPRVAFAMFRLLMLLTLLLISVTNAHALLVVTPEEQGSWRNYDADTRSITQLYFQVEYRDASTTTCNGDVCSTTPGVRSDYFIHLFGACHPTDCDWGRVKGERLTGDLKGWYYFYYDHGFAQRYVYARTYPESPGWLRLWIWTDFSDETREDYATDEWFVRQ